MEPTAAPELTIEQLYQNYHAPVLRYLERIVHNRETAEDLCQETFIKALRHWCQRDSQASSRAWLYRIATNTAFDHLRQQRRRSGVVSDADPYNLPTEPASMPGFDEASSVHAALSGIPACYRVPLVLHAYAGYDLKTIATALGCNVNTVKSRVHRGRMRFRQIYAAA
jgi:RNA polymerase sigma-70 factor (ECF subfamily)